MFDFRSLGARSAGSAGPRRDGRGDTLRPPPPLLILLVFLLCALSMRLLPGHPCRAALSSEVAGHPCDQRSTFICYLYYYYDYVLYYF